MGFCDLFRKKNREDDVRNECQNKMNTEKQQHFMRSLFMFMMTNSMLSNHRLMATTLKSVVHVLSETNLIRGYEKDECLLYFFREYACGCTPKPSDSEIRTSMIPVVHQYGEINIDLGTELISMVTDKMN